MLIFLIASTIARVFMPHDAVLVNQKLCGYWVEKKKDKKTNREIIHIEGFDEISIDLIKKEIEFYNRDSMMLKIRKLK